MPKPEKEDTKIQDIVEILRTSGVEAGKTEASQIVSEADKRAEQILTDARAERDEILKKAEEDAARLQRSAEANVRMAVAQGVNLFKELIEKSVLNQGILETLRKEVDSIAVKEIVLTIVKAYASAGFETSDLLLLLDEPSSKIIKDSIMKELSGLVDKPEGITISDARIPQGVVVKSRSKNLSIDVTPETLSEVLLSFIRPEFRDLFFAKEEQQATS